MSVTERLRMSLQAVFTLSRDCEGIREDMAKFIEEANKTILLKGAPKDRMEEAASIKSWRAEGNRLFLLIESGTYVRAPVAVLRLRKFLEPRLGKLHRIGIRGINISDFTVVLPVPKLPKPITGEIEAIPIIHSAELIEDKLTVKFKQLSYAELKKGIPDRTVSLIESKVESAMKIPVAVPPVVQVLKQSKQKPVKFKGDPAETALKLGWIKEFPGRGQWIYCPPYATLLEAIEELLVEEVAHKLGFQPCMLPKLIPLEVMKYMPGYLDGIPEGMYYVCPPPRDPSAFDHFKELFKVTREIPKEELRKVIKDPTYVLSPAQCEPFWFLFSHEILDADKLPIKLYDRSGWTYRWEGGGVEGLVRLQEFRRMEFVYYGLPDDIVKIRDSVLNESIRVADELLDLEWRVVPGVPFFTKEAAEISDIFDSKQVPAYDLEVYLPYRGPRETGEWLEVAAFFIHKGKFIEAFKIKEAKGREIWEGCTGMGVSRWVAGFLAQHGFDCDLWPKAVERRVRKYEVPRTLSWPKEARE